MVATRKVMGIRFSEEDVRCMGRTATGVRAILLDDDDEVVDTQLVQKGCCVTLVTENGYGKRTPEEQFRRQNRGGKGMIAINITEKTGPLASMRLTTGEEDMMLIRDDGTVIRMPVSSISIVSRYAQGVKVMRVDEGTRHLWRRL